MQIKRLQTDKRTTDSRWSERFTWTFSSGEPKTIKMTLIIWRNRKANFLKHPIVFTIHLHKELRYTVILITLQDRWNFTRYYLPYFSPLSLFCLAFTSVAMELSNVCHYTTSWEEEIKCIDLSITNNHELHVKK